MLLDDFFPPDPRVEKESNALQEIEKITQKTK